MHLGIGLCGPTEWVARRAQCGGRNPAAAPRAGFPLPLTIAVGPNPPALPPPGGTASIVPTTTLLSRRTTYDKAHVDFVQTNSKSCRSWVGSSLLLKTQYGLMPCAWVELKLSCARTSFEERAVVVAQSQSACGRPGSARMVCEVGSGAHTHLTGRMWPLK